MYMMVEEMNNIRSLKSSFLGSIFLSLIIIFFSACETIDQNRNDIDRRYKFCKFDRVELVDKHKNIFNYSEIPFSDKEKKLAVELLKKKNNRYFIYNDNIYVSMLHIPDLAVMEIYSSEVILKSKALK